MGFEKFKMGLLGLAMASGATGANTAPENPKEPKPVQTEEAYNLENNGFYLDKTEEEKVKLEKQKSILLENKKGVNQIISEIIRRTDGATLDKDDKLNSALLEKFPSIEFAHEILKDIYSKLKEKDGEYLLTYFPGSNPLLTSLHKALNQYNKTLKEISDTENTIQKYICLADCKTPEDLEPRGTNETHSTIQYADNTKTIDTTPEPKEKFLHKAIDGVGDVVHGAGEIIKKITIDERCNCGPDVFR